nr:hypothetical protein HAGR004_39110 [Bdellovibrio sp. HAGR004]
MFLKSKLRNHKDKKREVKGGDNYRLHLDLLTDLSGPTSKIFKHLVVPAKCFDLIQTAALRAINIPKLGLETFEQSGFHADDFIGLL